MQHRYRALWLSDVHLGTSVSRAGALLEFLDRVSAEVVYLNGDIVDLQRLKIRPRFPVEHRAVIERLLELAQCGTRVVYIPGNHDSGFRRLAGRAIGRIDVELEMRHVCADGRSLLTLHGDCLDRRVRHGTRLERFGAAAYDWLVKADARLDRLHSRIGRDYASLSAIIKLRLKSANEYIRRFEDTAARYARVRGFDGIVCGHIHVPRIRKIEGIQYANDGDWVEHRTALAETTDGQLQLLRWAAGSVAVESAPLQPSLAA